jgi:hypothetical protein
MVVSPEGLEAKNDCAVDGQQQFSRDRGKYAFDSEFSGWGETESTLYSDHCWTYCKSPDNR